MKSAAALLVATLVVAQWTGDSRALQSLDQVVLPQGLKLQEPEPKHPAPEPYSFSYTADSIGGQSSHQERGDGSGRVEGFYTILGEDGRERRVDYVADENGYRASVSTNEVGTRSQSSGDAEYKVELPSAKQLEAAKISYEQYKYLEDTHEQARLRHTGHQLPNFSTVDGGSIQSQFGAQFSGALSQQQPQVQFNQQRPQLQFNRQQQQQFSSFNNQQYPPRPATPSNYEIINPNLGVSTASSLPDTDSEAPVVDPDASWRGRAAKLQTVTNVNRQQQPLAESSTVAYNFTSQPVSANQAAQQAYVGSNQQLSSRFTSSGTFQQPRFAGGWQSGANTVKRPTTVLQRQLEAQFMQQASQLTDQDYPRQSIDGQRQFLGQQQVFAPQPVQPQVGAADYQQQFQKTVNSINRIRANYDADLGQPQQPFNQQQTNIISELSDEQQVVANDGGQTASVNAIDSTTTNQQQQVNEQSTQPEQPQQVVLVKPTRAPELVALNLNSTGDGNQLVETNSIASNFTSSSAADDQQQEVEQQRPAAIGNQQQQQQQLVEQTLKQTNDQQLVDQSISTQRPAQQVIVGRQQQQDIVSQQVAQRPSSVNQIIEIQRQDNNQQQLNINQQQPVRGLIMRPIGTKGGQSVFFSANSSSYFAPTTGLPTISTFAPTTTQQQQQQQFFPSTTTQLPRTSVQLNTLAPTRFAPYQQPTTTQLPATWRPQQQQVSVGFERVNATSVQRPFAPTTQLVRGYTGARNTAQPLAAVKGGFSKTAGNRRQFWQQQAASGQLVAGLQPRQARSSSSTPAPTTAESAASSSSSSAPRQGVDYASSPAAQPQLSFGTRVAPSSTAT